MDWVERVCCWVFGHEWINIGECYRSCGACRSQQVYDFDKEVWRNHPRSIL